MGYVALDDLDWDTSRRQYNGVVQYANSKLANFLFANELTRRYRDAGVVSTAVHPGLVYTSFLQNVPLWMRPGKHAILSLFARGDKVQGAYTQVWAAWRRFPLMLCQLTFGGSPSFISIHSPSTPSKTPGVRVFVVRTVAESDAWSPGAPRRVWA